MPWRSSKKQREVYSELVARHLDAVHRTAWRLTRNSADAEDLTQETFLRACKSLDQLTDASGAWLFRILRNAWIDQIRRSARRPQLVTLEEAPEPAAAPDPPLDVTDAVERARMEQAFDEEVVQAMNELPEEERLALLFQTFGGLSYQEISQALECPIGTVMSRLHRSKTRLRERLTAYAVRSGIVPRSKTGGDEHAQA